MFFVACLLSSNDDAGRVWVKASSLDDAWAKVTVYAVAYDLGIDCVYEAKSIPSHRDFVL